jgi:hypothetical protein
MGLKLNGRTHQLLVYTGDVNLLGDNLDNIKMAIETINYISEEVVPEVNTVKTEFMLLFHHQSGGQNQNVKIATRSFKNVAELKC